jgi:membrane-anchored protein YejM (alkaline phosphatase superfamily)
VSVRRRLLRWGSRLALVNAGLLAVIGLRYVWYYTSAAGAVTWLYVAVAYVAHWTLLAFIPYALVLVPVALLLPRPRLVIPLGVAIGAAGLSLTLLDSLVFEENRYHLSPLTAALLAPQTWAFTGLYLLVALAIEAMAARWLWQLSAAPPRPGRAAPVAVALGACVLASHAAYSWAEARYYVSITSFNHYLPMDVRLTVWQAQLDLVGRERALAAGDPASGIQAPRSGLHYPLAALRCSVTPPSLNVLLIVVDAMRADALTPDVAPHLTALARRAIRFEQHWSGGNSSRAGMFSLFYGLPGTYWPAFAGAARPPVLVDLFQQARYQLGLFSTAHLDQAVGLERTAFARVPNLRLKTVEPSRRTWARDRVMTDDWLAWLDRRDASRPFFGLLYFDSAQAKDFPADYPWQFPVRDGRGKQAVNRARYLTAVHYVDSLVGRALADLERRGLFDRTLIIATSDHGMEFDDNGQGFSGHGTAYSDYQMRTPLLVAWPGRPVEGVARRTSHHDVAPTLVTRLFGCENLPSDYSSGHDLFDGPEWSWLVAASYGDFALVEPDRVTVVYQSSYFETRDREYRLIARPERRSDVLRAALREMSRFYR